MASRTVKTQTLEIPRIPFYFSLFLQINSFMSRHIILTVLLVSSFYLKAHECYENWQDSPRDAIHNDYVQENMLYNVIVYGFAKTPKDESIMKLVELTGRKLHIKHPLDDVESAWRKPFGEDKGQQAIVISFKNRESRVKWLTAYKRSKLWYVKFYVTEQLTTHNLNLVKGTKRLAKENKWKHVWVRDGKVYVRQNDTSEVYTVKNLASVHSIMQVSTTEDPWER
uniref:FP protein C-terminal domain-containing protein n=1 Tax=Cacopsylla melanoneura TaxID=428564 RepID=A0A8D8Z2N5_9HEMI